MLMPKIFDTTPDGITWRDQPCTVMLRLVARKREAPQSKGDTSIKGTPMLKSVRGTDVQAKKQSFGKEN